MKAIAVMWCLSFVFDQASAQSPITLTAANTPIVATTFTVNSFVSASGLSVPSKGTNQTWNYTGNVLNTTTQELYQSTDHAYSSAAVYDTLGLDVLISSGVKEYGVFYNTVFDYGSNAIVEPGIMVPEGAANLSQISSGPTDSIWIAAQDDLYSTPVVDLAFPTTMNSNWSTVNAKRTTDMRVRVALLAGDSDFKKVSIFNKTDTVVGWGNLIVPAYGGSQISASALMIKEKEVRTDSFFLNDQVVSGFILSTFGLPAQGHDSAVYSYQFFAQGSMLPLLRIYYSDSTYSNTTSAFTYQVGNAAVVQGALAEPIGLFPNPATNRISVAASSGPFIVLDPLGRSYVVPQSENTIDVSALPSGVYFLSDGQHREKFVKQ